MEETRSFHRRLSLNLRAHGYSFPSGHSFNAAVVHISLALAFAAISRRSHVDRTIIGVAVGVSVLIGISRVMLGVHFPSDVVAGWMGGGGWTFLVFRLLSRDDNSPRPYFQTR
ncbi:phosphatase PAP2 family protein [Paracoccus yeei]|uniref:phosphatase PAP2 family protein n=1 Tax=Paracoccus yeei TaxID=147645 RepID=UPI001C8E0C3F|nr:phosphatase PAP2 family protein [Paracoccus yeei]